MSWRRAAVLALGAMALACSRPAASPEPPPRAERVVLVTIDTLRADHLGKILAGEPLTPALDALAAESVRFTDAIANSTVTRASHASMLTGLYPWRHGIPDNSARLKEGVVTLGERLRRRGVATGAVVSSFPMRELDRGFDDFHQVFDSKELTRNDPFASPASTTRAARAWLERHRQGPFFLLVHYFPPHGPYDPPERFRLPVEVPSGKLLPLSRSNYEAESIPEYQQLGPLRDTGVYAARYAANVRYADHHVGRLLRALRELGLYDSTAVIVTSDHGESLGEHRFFFCHGNLVYGEQADIPLLLKLPGGSRGGTRSTAAVEAVDLFSTVVELFGVAVPADVDGRSLLAELSAQATGKALRFTQSKDAELLSVVARPWKLTLRSGQPVNVAPGHPQRELYDLDRDPGESRDRLAERPQVADLLAQELRRRFTGFAPPEPIDPETQRQLRALGYVR